MIKLYKPFFSDNISGWFNPQSQQDLTRIVWLCIIQGLGGLRITLKILFKLNNFCQNSISSNPLEFSQPLSAWRRLKSSPCFKMSEWDSLGWLIISILFWRNWCQQIFGWHLRCYILLFQDVTWLFLWKADLLWHASQPLGEFSKSGKLISSFEIRKLLQEINIHERSFSTCGWHVYRIFATKGPRGRAFL